MRTRVRRGRCRSRGAPAPRGRHRRIRRPTEFTAAGSGHHGQRQAVLYARAVQRHHRRLHPLSLSPHQRRGGPAGSGVHRPAARVLRGQPGPRVDRRERAHPRRGHRGAQADGAVRHLHPQGVRGDGTVAERVLPRLRVRDGLRSGAGDHAGRAPFHRHQGHPARRQRRAEGPVSPQGRHGGVDGVVRAHGAGGGERRGGDQVARGAGRGTARGS